MSTVNFSTSTTAAIWDWKSRLFQTNFLVSGASVNLVVLVIAPLQQFNLPMAGAIISHNQYENVAIPVYLQ
jgi:hypothetical protein